MPTGMLHLPVIILCAARTLPRTPDALVCWCPVHCCSSFNPFVLYLEVSVWKQPLRLHICVLTPRAVQGCSLTRSSLCTPLVKHSCMRRCVLMCHAPRKEYYKKFLFEPYPVESHLGYALHDHLAAEVTLSCHP